jgi:hypothetical protein
MESEKALLKIKDLLEALSSKGENFIALKEDLEADQIFAKAVQQYDSVLEKLAQ